MTHHTSFSGVMYHASTSRLLLRIDQHTKFEMRSFHVTDSKYMIGAKFKRARSRDSDYAD